MKIIKTRCCQQSAASFDRKPLYKCVNTQFLINNKNSLTTGVNILKSADHGMVITDRTKNTGLVCD